MFENASPLELGWTLSAALGALIWYLFLFLVLRDEMRRRRTGVNGMVKLDITKGIVTGIVLGTKAAAYAIAGLLAMGAPANEAAGDSISILAIIFILNNVFLTLLAVYYLVNREQVNREMSAGEAKHRRATDQDAVGAC